MALDRTFKLVSGYTIPALGLGTWQAKPNEVKQAIQKALQVGYRHIDTATLYMNEKEIGEAISGFKDRESLFVTTKLWSTDHRKEYIRPALNSSLSDLRLSYLDLYLIHSPLAFKRGSGFFPLDDAGKLMLDPQATLKETWEELESLVDDGKVKSLGVSNFTITKLRDLLSYARIKPAVLQVELHPYLPQTELLEFAKKEQHSCDCIFSSRV